MQIRICASNDLVERINVLLGSKNRLYPNRKSDNSRLYLDVDDRIVEQGLSLLETADTPIEINPKDLF